MDQDGEKRGGKRRRLQTPEFQIMDQDEEKRGGERRRLLTPARSRSPSPREDDHEPDPDYVRSKSKRPSRSRVRTPRSQNNDSRERENEFENVLARLRMVEKELQRDRESRGRSRTREHRKNGRDSRRRSRSREVRGKNRESRRRSRTRERRQNYQSKSPSRHHDIGSVREKSRSPVFSIKDIAQIVQSMKGNLPSQPSNSNDSSHKNIDHKNILPNFDPSSKNQRISTWLKKVNECALVYGWDDKTTIHFAMQKLQGLAKIWYESLDTILYSWQEWQDKLISAFPCDQNYGQLLEDMLRRKSKFNESIEVYYYEKLALLNQCDIRGKRAVDCIIHGISDRTMKSSALALRCSNPDQLLEFLMSNKDSGNSFERYKYRNLPDNSKTNNQGTKLTNRPQSQGPFCFNCKEKGHHYAHCLKPLIKCNYCNKVGHKSEACYSKPENKITKNDDVRKTMCISSSNQNSKFIKSVKINKLVVEAFIDFGSDVTLIKESLISNLGVEHDHVESIMKGFGNSLVKSLGNIEVDLEIDSVKARVLCKVVKDCLLDKPILVGQSFTELPHVIVYKDLSQLNFLTVNNEMPQIEPSRDNIVKVFANHDIELYGPATIDAYINDNFTGSILLKDKLVGKPGQQFTICGGIYRVNKGKIKVALSVSHSPCLLMEGFLLCRAERVDSVNKITKFPTMVESFHTTDITEPMLNIGKAVSNEHKDRLVKILNKYKHCFASNLNELGCTNATEMSIEINDSRPIVFRPYRLSHHEREQVRNMVDEMLSAGIIRESTSEYASPIILVRKPDGSLRMCIDYRKLNSVTVKERYPMPIIEDEIARLSGQAYFITLDLASGYYQVPIAESSKPLTSFVTPDGQFEFNRMPFGLANAPAVFQRMMNRILGSARFTKAMVYIDDLLIFGTSPSECLDRLEEVLQLMEKSNLTLKLSKCSFLQQKIDYLGYEISAEGVKPGEKKIQSVQSFPQPTDVHKVRQFLGLVSYFRKFINNFAQIAYPLTKLLKKDAVWEWSNSQTSAFETLKAKLIHRPVLAIYDHSAELELHTDASKHGIGGILLQKSHDSNDLRPIAYYSRQTSPEERNFHSYELETLAVVFSLKKFRIYLLGKKFKILTDCSALRSTFSKRDLIPRIARWWLMLQEFDCSVEYKPGAKMLHVDALSRNPAPHDIDMHNESFPSVMTISNEDWLLTLQLGDSELCRTRDILLDSTNPKDLQHIKDNYVLKDNKLFKCVNGDKNDLRWVVPKGARWQVCKMSHDDIGHFGVEKTLNKIKKKYWFPKMSRFVKKYVNACIECAFAKQNKNNQEGLLYPIPKIDLPFHSLHADHLGPFVKSKRGNSYLLVVVDAFTKFVFVKPVRNTKTVNVVKVLDDIFYTFRNPVRLITDRGSCFTSHAFRKYCLEKGIKHILNAVASPKSNGQVERYNRTILSSLTAQNFKNNEKDWDNEVGKIQWGINNTMHKTTGRTPAEVMFGTGINCDMNPSLDEISQETCVNVELDTLRKEVKEKIDSEQVKQKSYYDKNRKPAHIYKEGDLVKITQTTIDNNGKSRKLLPPYVGPFRVIRVLGNDRYKIKSIPGFSNMKHKRGSTVAADRMKPWIHIAALQVNDDTETDNDEVDSQ